jgi:PAS domain S-box-containing protein
VRIGKHSWYGYGLAGATLVVFLAARWAGPWADHAAFLLYFGVILASALIGGMRAGVTATVLATFFMLCQYTRAAGDSPVATRVDLLFTLILVHLAGLFSSYLSWEYSRKDRTTDRFRKTLADLRQAVLLTDDEGRVTFLNRAAQSLTGWPKAEAHGKPLLRVLHLVEEASRRLVPDPRTAPHPVDSDSPPHAVLVVSRDGVERPVEYSARPLRETEDVQGGTLVTLWDVSECRRLAHEVRQRDERFQALAAGAPSGVLLFDRAGQCTFSNAAAQALGGFTREESWGEGWAEFVHPEDEAVATELLTCLRQRKPFAGECRFQDGQGVVHWARFRLDAGHPEDRHAPRVLTLEDRGAGRQLEDALADNESLRKELRHHQHHESQYKVRLAALEVEQAQLQQQLAEREQVEAERRHVQAREQEAWHRERESLHRKLHQQTEANQHLQTQLAERNGTEDALRKAHAQQQDAWQQMEAQLRQELHDLAQMLQPLQAQLAEHTEIQQRLHAQLAERHGLEEDLRKGHAQSQEEQERVVEQLRRELTESQEREKRSAQELNDLRAMQERAKQERRRQADDEKDHSAKELADIQAHRDQLAEEVCSIRAILAGLGDAVCVLDPEGRIKFVNPAAEQLLGQPATDLLGKPIGELTSDIGGTALPASHTSQPTVSRRTGARFRTPEGAVRVDYTLSSLWKQEQLEGAVLTLREAVSPKPNEQAPAVQPEDATPTADVLGHVTERLPPAAAGLAQVVAALPEPAEALGVEVRRFSVLVDGLSTVGPMGREGLMLNPECVDLSTMLDRAVETAYPLLHDRGHHLTVTLPLVPFSVVLDAARLEQVLVALLDNASRYSPPGGRILLAAELKGAEVIFRIKDEGTGIPDDSLSVVGRGPGFGLALARDLAALHGGHLDMVNGDEGAGSEFVLRLPHASPQRQQGFSEALVGAAG